MNRLFALLLLLISGIVELKAQVLFTKTFGDASVSESAASMIRTAGNSYVLAGIKTPGDIYLVKTDSAGNELWSKTIHDSGYAYSPQRITELPGGDLVIVGRKQLIGFIPYDAFIMKTDSAGNVIWENKYFFNPYSQVCRAVKTTSDGNIIITGSSQNATGFSHGPFTAKLDTAGTVIWSNFDNEFEPYDIVELNDGSFVSAGYECGICAAGSHNVMVAKFKATGETMWVRTPLVAGINDEWHFIDKTLSGDLIVCGSVDTVFNPNIGLLNTNIIIAKLDTAGTILWSNRYSSPYRDYEGAIVETADSIFHLTGAVQHVFLGQFTPVSETAHLQYDQNGNLLCTNFFNPRYSAGNAMVLSSDDKLVIGGFVQNDTMIAANMLLQKIEPVCCVSPLPVIIQTPDTVICTGDTFMLYINSLPNTTVTWYEENSFTPLSTTDSLQIPPPNFDGNFYVVVEGDCGVAYSPGLKIKSGNIPFAPVLQVNTVSPSTSICAGDSVSLHSSFGQTGITIPHWIYNGTEIAQGPVNLWVKDSGDYWLVASTRCDTLVSNIIHITVSTAAPSLPSIIASDTTLCGGTTSVVLNTAPCDGCIYHWYDETGVYAETDSAFYNVSLPHIYKVTVINPCDSTSSTDSVIIQNGILPAIPIISQAGDTLFSTYVTNNQWYFNSTLIPGATGPFYLPQQTGVYSVTYTEGSCTVQSPGFNYIVISVNEVFNENNFQVYKNNGSIYIKTTGAYSLRNIMLFAVDGKQKMVVENINTKTFNLQLPRELSNGIYFLRLDNGKTTATVKLFLKD